MFNTIRNITGNNTSYLKKPLCWALIEGIFMAVPYVLVALLVQKIFENSIHVYGFWCYYVPILLCFGLRAVSSLKSYGGGMRAGYEAGTAIRLHLGEYLRKLPMGYFDEHDTGELANRLFHNVGMVEMMVSHFLTQAVTNLAGPLTLLCALFWIQPGMTLALTAMLLMAIPLLAGLMKMADRGGDKRIQAIDTANSAILEYLHGIRVFKSFNLTGMGFQRLKHALRAVKDFSIRFEIKAFAISLSYSAALEAGFIALMMIGLYRVQLGAMSAAQMMVFLILCQRFYRPLHRFAENAALTRAAFAGARAVSEVLDAKTLTGEEDAPQINTFDIQFEKVRFGYRGQDVLRDISFSVKENSMTAFVGPSGSGKSTLTSLIARFWDVNEGMIRIGGVNVRSLPPDRLLGYISLVFQQVYLFNDTVMNNINIGNPGASPGDIRRAARTACCHEFIEQLPKGYDTVIGEGGTTLSGGEKQRIAIARAILKDAPILLLDEATASLDPYNDLLIQRAINNLVKSRTVMVVAHRLHTIAAADQIIVLNRGGIMQTGTHRELLAQTGWYADMWQEQHHPAGFHFKGSNENEH